jgi:hypothetical protein
MNRRPFPRVEEEDPEARDEEENKCAGREKSAPGDCVVLSMHLV